MRKLGPVGISALLSLALLALAVLGVAAIRSGGDGVPPTVGRPTQPDIATSGDPMPCPGGGQVQSYYNLAGGEFSLAGRLASIDGDGKSLLVKGPTQYIRLGLADNARVEGTLTGGPGQGVRIVRFRREHPGHGRRACLRRCRGCCGDACADSLPAAITIPSSQGSGGQASYGIAADPPANPSLQPLKRAGQTRQASRLGGDPLDAHHIRSEKLRDGD